MCKGTTQKYIRDTTIMTSFLHQQWSKIILKLGQSKLSNIKLTFNFLSIICMSISQTNMDPPLLLSPWLKQSVAQIQLLILPVKLFLQSSSPWGLSFVLVCEWCGRFPLCLELVYWSRCWRSILLFWCWLYLVVFFFYLAISFGVPWWGSLLCLSHAFLVWRKELGGCCGCEIVLSWFPKLGKWGTLDFFEKNRQIPIKI